MAKNKRNRKPVRAESMRVTSKKPLQKRKKKFPKSKEKPSKKRKPVKPVKAKSKSKAKVKPRRGKPSDIKRKKPVHKKPVRGKKKGKPVKKPISKKAKSKPKKPAPKKKGERKYVEPGGKNKFYRKVKNVLWRFRRGDFKNYAELIRNEVDEEGKPIPYSSPAGRVYKSCPNVNCDDAEILAIYDSFTEASEDLPKPVIPKELQNALDGECDYWFTVENPFYQEIPEYVWIISPMLFGEGKAFTAESMMDRVAPGDEDKLKPALVRGNKRILEPFVAYMNELQKAKVNKYGYVIYGDPYWNKQETRWEVEIMPVKEDNTPYDYGYNPVVSVQQIPEEELPTLDQAGVKKAEEKREVTPVRSIQEIQAETELEKQKQRTFEAQAKAARAEAMKNILDLLNKGIITKQDAKEMIAALEK